MPFAPHGTTVGETFGALTTPLDPETDKAISEASGGLGGFLVDSSPLGLLGAAPALGAGKRLAQLLKVEGKGLKFGPESLKDFEKALKVGMESKADWSPLTQNLDAFNNDSDAMRRFARIFGATSPNTSVGQNTRESLAVQKALLEGREKFTQKQAGNLGVTNTGSKWQNLNRAIKGEPLASREGQPGKVEAFANLLAGQPHSYDSPVIPIDVYALSGVGASEPEITKAIKGVRELMKEGGLPSKGYSPIYNAAADAYASALNEVAPGLDAGITFPPFWEGVRMGKGYGESPGLKSFLTEQGLLVPGGMMDAEKIGAAHANFDPSRIASHLPNVRKAQVSVPDLGMFAPKPGNDDIRKIVEQLGGQGVSPYQTANPEAAMKIADAYQGLQHTPDDLATQVAYKEFADQIKQQWDAIKKAGYDLQPWTQEGQPYANSAEMMKDLAENKRLSFFQGGDIPPDHPLAAIDPDTGLSYNDMFRAVHDVMGHGAEGFQFGPLGEMNAAATHATTFSPEAQKALFSETVGQNSWVNYGPHMRGPEGQLLKKGDPGYLPQAERPFGQQKSGLLPDDVLEQIRQIMNPEKAVGMSADDAADALRASLPEAPFRAEGTPFGNVKLPEGSTFADPSNVAFKIDQLRKSKQVGKMPQHFQDAINQALDRPEHQGRFATVNDFTLTPPRGSSGRGVAAYIPKVSPLNESRGSIYLNPNMKTKEDVLYALQHEGFHVDQDIFGRQQAQAAGSPNPYSESDIPLVQDIGRQEAQVPTFKTRTERDVRNAAETENLHPFEAASPAGPIDAGRRADDFVRLKAQIDDMLLGRKLDPATEAAQREEYANLLVGQHGLRGIEAQNKVYPMQEMGDYNVPQSAPSAIDVNKLLEQLQNTLNNVPSSKLRGRF